MNRTFALSAAALFLSLGIVPCVVNAEDDAPPPEGRHEKFRPRREGAGMPGLSEEERTKLDALTKGVTDALAAYKASPSDTTKAALKTQVAAAFEFRQQLMIDRAKKALANKDEEVNKQVERLIQPHKERPERPGHREVPAL